MSDVIGLLILTLILGIPISLFLDLVLAADGRGLVFINFRNLSMKNRLYVCGDCKKLLRDYQYEIKNKSGEARCPHCNRMQYGKKVVKKKAKWMNVHPDCPKIDVFKYFQLKLNVRSIKKRQREIADQDYFEEYNKLKVDMKWIENLTKRQGE